MALVAAAVMSSAAAAQAEGKGKGEVIAVVVEGRDSDALTGWIEDRVNAPDTLTEGDAFRSALRARGALPLRAGAAGDARDVQLIARAHAAANDLGVDRAILVDVHRTPRGTRVHVWDIDSRTKAALVDSDISLLPSASPVEEARAIFALAPALSRSAAAAPPLTPIAGSPAPSSAEPASRQVLQPEPDGVTPVAPTAVDSTPLSVRAGLGVGMRHVSYVDRVTPALRPYDLGAAPLVTVSAVAYPLAFTGAPFVRDLGITGGYGQAVGLASKDSAGTHVDTTWQSFDVGIAERISLTHALQLDVLAGYGVDDFRFAQSLAGAAAALPSATYRFVRIGADAHYRVLGALSAFGGASYLDVLGSGYIGALFPRESVAGVEGRIGASYSLARNWEVSVTAAYARMFFTFNPLPGDAMVAGGALDEQTRVVAGFSYVM